MGRRLFTSCSFRALRSRTCLVGFQAGHSRGSPPSRGCGGSPGSRVVGAGGPRDSSVPRPSLGRCGSVGKGCLPLHESAQPHWAGREAQPRGTGRKGWMRLRQALAFFRTPPSTAEELRSAGEQCPAGRRMLRAAPSLGAHAGRRDGGSWWAGLERSEVKLWPGPPRGCCVLARGSSSAGSWWWHGVRSRGSLLHVLAAVSLLSRQPDRGWGLSLENERIFVVFKRSCSCLSPAGLSCSPRPPLALGAEATEQHVLPK